MNEFRIRKRRLITDNFNLKFDYEIGDVKFVKDVYLVLLKIPSGAMDTDNLYGITKEGKVKWRVQDATKVKEFNNKKNTPYVGIRVFNNEIVKINNLMGIRYEVNPLNGHLSNAEIVK